MLEILIFTVIGIVSNPTEMSRIGK